MHYLDNKLTIRGSGSKNHTKYGITTIRVKSQISHGHSWENSKSGMFDTIVDIKCHSMIKCVSLE